MSSLSFLITELQSLAGETRRKHPEIREAAEKSLAILRSSPEQVTIHLASNGPQSDDLLRPVFMGCATKNSKVVAISLGSLQRLIALKAVPQSAVPLIIKIMGDAMNQGVDIQLRILQTLLSLITNFPAVHGDLLGDALLLCFKLQESKIPVVSSTAAATLRQLVMFVVDKVVVEDKMDIPQSSLIEVTVSDGSKRYLGPAARDAHAVFEDLCLLANAESPGFLRLEVLHKTFALELIESVLTNYHALFRKHQEFLLLLPHHLCPLLLKSLSDRPVFPLTLRCTRVVFLLLKQFSGELKTQAEIFLMLLIRIVGDDGEAGGSEARPAWMRVLGMEIMRGLCNDAELMRNIWERYDACALDSQGGPKVFTALITALTRLVTEKPALLGVAPQMFGVGVSSGDEGGVSTAGMVAGMVANAASGVAGMMSAGTGLSLHGSAMKVQCIDQLDKADAPPIPEPYVYLLGVQCLISLCEGFASFTGPIYTSLVIHRRSASDAIRAPPALDVSILPLDDHNAKQLRIVRAMVDNGWHALLAALSFIVTTNISDELFVDVLASYQAMTNVAGMLALSTPRDAFFTSLAKFAIPTRVVSSLDSYIEPPTPRSAVSISENFGLTHSPSQPPGLSERNIACLKVFVSSAMFLAGSLGESWFGVLEAVQNADYVLTKGVKASGTSTRRSVSSAGTPSRSSTLSVSQADNSSSSGTGGAAQPRHPLLSDLDSESLLGLIQRMFDASKILDDDAFRYFVNALCRLSAEMVGMQTSEESTSISEFGTTSSEDLWALGLSPNKEIAHRRRLSGIHLPKSPRSGDFGISKLGSVALLNIHRFIHRSPEVAWNAITAHLLSIIRLPSVPQAIRIQAARVLDEILIMVPRNLSSTGDLQAEVQRRVLDVLAHQVIPDSRAASNSNTIVVELRRMGIETLHQILQESGHTLVVGWEVVFEMLSSVCKSTLPPAPSIESMAESLHSFNPSKKTPPLEYSTEKGYTALVKIAFQSLTLVCDSVSSLSPNHLRLCITTLGQFGRQPDTNIALTAAESLMWSVSDAIQSKRKDADKEPEYSALWMFLLLEVLGLCSDARPEVRIGAIQTLFRTMQLYGATLSLETWEECIWNVTFPLLDSITQEVRYHASSSSSPPLSGSDLSSVAPEQAWNESKILALQSIGSIFHDFLTSKIMRLASFSKAWEVFAQYVQDAVLLDHPSITTPALRCLEKAVKASGAAAPELKANVGESWERVWTACDCIGHAILVKVPTQSAFSPSRSNHPLNSFTQETLVAYVDLIQSTRAVSRRVDGAEWELGRLTRMMAILKGVLTYPNSQDYRPDIDGLTPVQAVVMQAIDGIDLSTPGSPSLIMRDLAEYATLPFLAAFSVSPNPTTKSAQKRITYIAVLKKVMPTLVDLFSKFKSSVDIYVDGTVETVLSAYLIPVKLKYECPPASKIGNDPPLWKTATEIFVRIVKECVPYIKTLGKDIPDGRIDSIWRQVLDVFRGGILADCSAAETFSLEEQYSEESFDLALIAALETDVVPYIGDPRVPDFLPVQLAKVLHQGSRIYRLDGTSATTEEEHEPNGFSYTSRTMIHKHEHGHTDRGSLVSRERFSYSCFDLLFSICADVTKDQEPLRRRLAALSIPSLLDRCRTTMVGYVADEALRGNLPFPRAREEELSYVLIKLLSLRLWPGTLWAAFSEEPSKYCIHPPNMNSSQRPSDVIADAVKRSSIAHLFYFYPVLCEIACRPHRTPTPCWLVGDPCMLNEAAVAAEFDARALAKECLKLIGKEMNSGVDG